MSENIILPVTYNLLKPFPFNKLTSTILAIVMAIGMLSVLILILYLIFPYIPHHGLLTLISIILFIGLFRVQSCLYNKYIRKTEIIGTIEIHKDHFILLNRKVEFRKVGKIIIERYILQSVKDQSLPYWKQCYKLEMQTQNLKQEEYLIALPAPNEGKPSVPDLFRALKHSSKDLYVKTEVY